MVLNTRSVSSLVPLGFIDLCLIVSQIINCLVVALAFTPVLALATAPVVALDARGPDDLYYCYSDGSTKPCEGFIDQFCADVAAGHVRRVSVLFCI